MDCNLEELRTYPATLSDHYIIQARLRFISLPVIGLSLRKRFQLHFNRIFSRHKLHCKKLLKICLKWKDWPAMASFWFAARHLACQTFCPLGVQRVLLTQFLANFRSRSNSVFRPLQPNVSLNFGLLHRIWRICFIELFWNRIIRNSIHVFLRGSLNV